MAALAPQRPALDNSSVKSLKEPFDSDFIFIPFEKLWLKVRPIEECYVIFFRV